MDDEQMILDNIDESVNDEGKIVSCKWLSLSLSLNINKAIRLLEEYNDKSGKELDVLYFVGGKKKDKDENHLTLSYKLAKQDSLEKVKSTFDEVTTCHIYSVQKTCIKDVGVLYTNHLDVTNEYLSQINQGSAIQCDLVKDLSETRAQRTRHSTNDISNGFHDDFNYEEEKTKHQPTANDNVKHQNSSKTSKNPPKSKKETVAKPFFGKGTSKKKDVVVRVDSLQEGAKDVIADKSNEVKQLDGKGKGEKNEISAAFAKTKKKPDPPTEKVKDENIEIEKDIDLVQLSDDEKENHSDDEKRVSKKNKKENHSDDEKRVSKKNKKENHLVSTVEENINTEKSKKRKTPVVNSESDDDDDYEKFLTKSKDSTYMSPENKKSKEKTTVNYDDDIDVIEPTPEPIKKKKRRRTEKDESTNKKLKDKNLSGEEIEKKEKIDAPKVADENKNSTGGKRRGRRMVMKSKQYLDEDGFMVTRKEYESESFSEESDSEMTEEKLNTLSPEKKKAVEQKKVVIDLEKKTKAHLSKPKTQALLMNFFKKK